jgi:hypothetical protein
MGKAFSENTLKKIYLENLDNVIIMGKNLKTQELIQCLPLLFPFQILLTQDSARVHREVLKNMPILRRLSRAKLDDQQVKLMGNILDDLAEYEFLLQT